MEVAPVTARDILAYCRSLGRLKNTQRAGWRLRGIKDCESVADHAYRATHLVMVLADALAAQGLSIDAARALRMAQVHEIGEAILGDIPQTADTPLPPAVKHDAEAAAVARLTSPLGAVGAEYRRLWEEFEAGETIEARLVRAADKLEMLLQAQEYETVGYRCLDEFWSGAATRRHFGEFPVVAEIVALLESERPGAPR
jgi:putative hydrolase of HD superfamily